MTNRLNRLKDFFAYSRTERNGILILFVILLLTIAINILLPSLIKTDTTDFSEFKEAILAFEKSQDAMEDSINNLRTKWSSFSKDEKLTLKPFPFDPNNLPFKKWKELGLRDRQIEMIKNYEQKGGKFYQKEDLKKMYCISDEEYEILEPYVVIESNFEATPKLEIIPFQFDPNSISIEELLSMNIRENLANAIVNFKNKGGKFYTKEDLKKIYTLTEQEFSVLEPFILIEKDSAQINPKLYKANDSLLVDLNSADSIDLQQLKGIGPSFSKRIIKYRELLGGYSNVNQLLEVYGMDKTRFDGIKDHIQINTDLLIKININQATIKEMTKHPYIEFYVAKSIITYRNEIGSFKNLEEIKKAKLIYEELYQKIVPYLTIN